MIKAILFDCGGVLVYPKAGFWQRAVDRDEILGGRKPDIDPVKAAAAFKKFEYILDEGQLISGLGHEYRLRREFLICMNRELSAGLCQQEIDALAHSLTYNDARYQLYEDSLAGVRRLKGKYRIGFVSNAMPSMVRAITNQGLADGLDCFTVSCLIGCQKPDERIYLTALEEMGIGAEECVFVEDLKANLEAAAHLGMYVVRMKRPFYYAVPVPDFAWDGATVHDLTQLEELLESGAFGPCGA